MRTVKKFLLPPAGLFDLRMPSGAELLDAAPVSADNVALWALVDEARPLIERRFLLTITGKPIETTVPLVHVASFASRTKPPLEFHLFEAAGAVPAMAVDATPAFRKLNGGRPQ